MTLETETFETETFAAGAALRTTGFGAALRALLVGFDLAAFLAAALTGFFATGREGGRDADLAALARCALGLAVVALATRFAVLAGARFVFERDAGRRTPFARLLLMGLNLKRLLTLREQPGNCGGAYHSLGPKSTETSICGCFKPVLKTTSTLGNNKEKC